MNCFLWGTACCCVPFQVCVKDDGLMVDEVIGSMEVPVCELTAASPTTFLVSGFSTTPAWFPLRGSKPKSQVAALQLAFKFIPDPAVCAALPRLPAVGGWLHLHAIGAKGLVAVQGIGKQDPFLEASLGPVMGKGVAVRTKPAVDAGADPLWNQTLQVMVCREIRYVASVVCPLHSCLKKRMHCGVSQ
jgi:hypothetical protein